MLLGCPDWVMPKFKQFFCVFPNSNVPVFYIKTPQQSKDLKMPGILASSSENRTISSANVYLQFCNELLQEDTLFVLARYCIFTLGKR